MRISDQADITFTESFAIPQRHAADYQRLLILSDEQITWIPQALSPTGRIVGCGELACITGVR